MKTNYINCLNNYYLIIKETLNFLAKILTNNYLKLIRKVLVNILVFLGISIGWGVYANEVQIFTIYNRDANEVNRNIQAFLPPGAVTAVEQNKIILQTDEENLATVTQIIAAMDVIKPQLKLEVYRGRVPDDLATQVIATTQEPSNKIQVLYVEDGAKVAVTENNLIKLTTSLAGEQQVATSQKHTKTNNETVAIALATVTEEIANLQAIIAEIMRQISAKEQELRQTRVALEQARLTAELLDLKNNLNARKINLAGLKAKYASLTAASTNTASTLTKHTASYGEMAQEFLELPEGLYLQAKMLTANKVKVDIQIIQASRKIKQSASILPVSEQMHTVVQLELGRWLQIKGQEVMSQAPTTTIYSTNTNTNDRENIWLRVTVRLD